MNYDYFKQTTMEHYPIGNWNVFPTAKEIARIYGEGLQTATGRIEVVRKYGYEAYSLALSHYIWISNPHHISEDVKRRYDEDVEKYKKAHDGIATTKDLLTF